MPRLYTNCLPRFTATLICNRKNPLAGIAGIEQKIFDQYKVGATYFQNDFENQVDFSSTYPIHILILRKRKRKAGNFSVWPNP